MEPLRSQVILFAFLFSLSIVSCSKEKNNESKYGGFEAYYIGLKGNHPKDPSAMRAFCADGSDYACLMHDVYFVTSKPEFFNGDGLKRLSNDCHAGKGSACHAVSMVYQYGFFVAMSHEKAKKFATTACDLDWAIACTDAGDEESPEDYKDGDGARSTFFYTKACMKGDLAGCTALAYNHRNGIGVPRSSEKSAYYAEKACKGGNGSGCNHLAHLYLHGELVEKSLVKAQELYGKGCDLGSSVSCQNYGTSLADGEVGTPDFTRALQYYQLGCDWNNRESCAAAAYVLLHDLSSEPNSKDRAKVLLEKACDLNFSDSCAELTVLATNSLNSKP